jgi:hypothetical protein
MEKKAANEFKVFPEMSMKEFKAWLEGFSECFKSGSSNKAQWKRIEERLKTVSVSQEIVYRDRPYWWPTWYTYNISAPVWGSGTADVPHIQETIVTCSNSDIIGAAVQIGRTEAMEFTV